MYIEIKAEKKYTITKYPPRYNTTVTQLIRDEMNTNFKLNGRPTPWKQNTKATTQWKRRNNYSLKANVQTGNMWNALISGRIYTRLRGGHTELQYSINTSSAEDPNIFIYPLITRRNVIPFGNPNAKAVTIKKRPYDHLSKDAYGKILNVYRGKIEKIVLNIPYANQNLFYSNDSIMRTVNKSLI